MCITEREDVAGKVIVGVICRSTIFLACKILARNYEILFVFQGLFEDWNKKTSKTQVLRTLPINLAHIFHSYAKYTLSRPREWVVVCESNKDEEMNFHKWNVQHSECNKNR